ncbi:hypothetical protein PORCRE_85 [Porphyromonas crevioricanis JCM 15906]|uniref:Uncharacterized protein n=1 Tax=Porphyromonas crevioricanis JCM 15906 TaxID=1305617 RepID=S4N935_9PORP|nr:hypothetical protein PORCRE_85 [Porphyromonas crevioricanis JCM 15906]
MLHNTPIIAKLHIFAKLSYTTLMTMQELQAVFGKKRGTDTQ